MSDREDDPCQDPQCAESWQALTHLLAAAQAPLDTAALTARITARIERRARRRRWQFAGGGLAAAAALAAIALFVTRQQPAVQVVGAGAAQLAQAEPAAAAPANGAEPAAEPFTPWEDDLEPLMASLASEAQAVEARWQEQPDSIALLQSRVDEFEKEMSDGSL